MITLKGCLNMLKNYLLQIPFGMLFSGALYMLLLPDVAKWADLLERINSFLLDVIVIVDALIALGVGIVCYALVGAITISSPNA